MGRASKLRSLSVWMNGERVGDWRLPPGTVQEFSYEESWLSSEAARPISLSFPLRASREPYRVGVESFFDNLLPDSTAIRSRLRDRFSTPSAEAFDLLSAIGRDCVGAFQLLPGDEIPTRIDRIEAVPLTDEGVERHISMALSGSRILGQRLETEESRIAIAGAQEKTALLFHKGKWCRPLGATPTTHILKLPLGLIGHLQMDMQNSVENEWLCLRLLRAFGLPTASCEIAEFGARKVLVVDRFDRTLLPAGWIARLPQEDFCQAMGFPSSKKYESDGGPGMRDILQVLDASRRAAEDKRAFIKVQILFWMLAATDGHAKNFSLFHERGGTYRLTPFYDVLSAWPIIGRGANRLNWHQAKLAMAVRSKNVHSKLKEIQPRHWEVVSRAGGLGTGSALLEELARQTPIAIAEVNRQLPAEFPAAVADAIFEGLQRMAAQLGPAASVASS